MSDLGKKNRASRWTANSKFQSRQKSGKAKTKGERIKYKNPQQEQILVTINKKQS